jgi:hypothetical protein
MNDLYDSRRFFFCKIPQIASNFRAPPFLQFTQQIPKAETFGRRKCAIQGFLMLWQKNNGGGWRNWNWNWNWRCWSGFWIGWDSDEGLKVISPFVTPICWNWIGWGGPLVGCLGFGGDLDKKKVDSGGRSTFIALFSFHPILPKPNVPFDFPHTQKKPIKTNNKNNNKKQQLWMWRPQAADEQILCNGILLADGMGWT